MDRSPKILACLLAAALPFFSTNVSAKETPETLFQQGLDYIAQEDFKKAEKTFIKVTKDVDNHYASYFNLSYIYLQQQNYKQSLKYLKTTAELNPFDLRVKKMLSTTFFQLNDLDKASAETEQVIEKLPTDIPSHKKLAIIHMRNKNYDKATAELTLVKNLAPSDKNNALLLAASYTLKEEYEIALEKIERFKNNISTETGKSLYSFLLTKNNRSLEAKKINATVSDKSPTDIIDMLLAHSMQKIMENETSDFNLITKYENPQVTQRIVKRQEHEQQLQSVTQTSSSTKSKTRPLQWKATVTETFEHYDRDPRNSSPINGLNVTSNVKLEGKTKNNIALSAEFESFYNRWDDNEVDYYKINALKRNDFEIDVGKFSSKHFPTLVSYPTVLDGVRIWKQLSRKPFNATPMENIEQDGPVNLGEMYRKNNTDTRFFKDIEITAAIGRTAERKNVGDRREENEDTLETSGQFEQWTQSYRLYSKFAKYFEIGASASYTTDVNEKAVVSSSTDPIESMALGFDGGIDLLDNKLNFDFEVAFGDYNLDLEDYSTKHDRDAAWLASAQYKILDSLTLNYDYKNIGRNFQVEGASQTQDKITHEYELAYKPKTPEAWSIKSQTIGFKPEIVNANGGGDSKKRYRTFESTTTFLLPDDATYTFDYEYYRERTKCGCSHYRKTTMEHSAEWEYKPWKMTLKPSYTFERKDDMVSSATDEKLHEYAVSLECNFIKNLEIDYSWEREIKTFRGFTNKSYHQHVNSLEAKYTFIPSRMDARIKLSRDFKDPSDSNKIDIDTYLFEYTYKSKSGDHKVDLSFERKLNVYKPWAVSSAYKQNYWEVKYTQKF